MRPVLADLADSSSLGAPSLRDWKCAVIAGAPPAIPDIHDLVLLILKLKYIFRLELVAAHSQPSKKTESKSLEDEDAHNFVMQSQVHIVFSYLRKSFSSISRYWQVGGFKQCE